MKKLAVSFWILLSSVSLANVSGKKLETLGTGWTQMPYAAWVTSPDALVTPEVVRLATQSCLRDAQEALDVPAYSVLSALLAEMRERFRPETASEPTLRVDLALARLTDLVSRLDTIQARGPDEYRTRCEAAVTATWNDDRARRELAPLYLGRMAPALAPELPAAIAEKLAALAKKGFRPAPLTWEGLRHEICALEGYYGTSDKPEHWKLFSTTRALAEVLPDPGDERSLVAAVRRAPAVVQALEKLDRYGAVAGRPNGASLGSPKAPPSVRLTGTALGTTAPALLASFTTSWRESLQRRVIEQNYPEQPFALLSSDVVLAGIEGTFLDVAEARAISQSEWGIAGLWDSLFPWYGPLHSPGELLRYGELTAPYVRATSIAWLAANAEANLRQNEKLTGIEKTSGALGDVTTLVTGAAFQFTRIETEIEAALESYRAVDADLAHVPPCVSGLKTLAARASDALESQRIARLPEATLRPLLASRIAPVVADIGMEVRDEAGDAPEGLFRLQLASGRGRALPVTLGGHRYVLWTPSAMVLHADRALTTTAWQTELLEKIDPVAP